MKKIFSIILSTILIMGLVGCSTVYEIKDQESYDKGVERAEDIGNTVEIIDKVWEINEIKLNPSDEDYIHGMLSVAIEQLDLSEEDEDSLIKLFGEEKGKEYIKKHKELLIQVKDVYNYPVIDDEASRNLSNVICDLEELNEDMTNNMISNMMGNMFSYNPNNY